MTAIARRGATAPPTLLQRLHARLYDERLVSALEDYADRLDGYAARADALGHHWVAATYRRDANDVRRALLRHLR